MRKLTTLFALLIFALIGNAQGPCVADPTNAGNPPGLYNLPLPVAYSNQGYDHVIEIITDTALTGNLKVKAEKICAITGLPAGAVTAPAYNGIDAWNNSGNGSPWSSVQGCFIISISAEDLTNALGNNDSLMLPVAIYIDALVKGNPIPATYTWLSTLGGIPPCGMALVYYDTLKIQRIMSLNEIAVSNKFSINDNYPNPFSGSTQINYTTHKEEPIAFTVYDMVGKMVYQQNYHSNAGTNSITFNAEGLSSGMYTYTLSNGMYAYTRKLLIQQ